MPSSHATCVSGIIIIQKNTPPLPYFPVYTGRAGHVDLAVEIRAIQDDGCDCSPMKALPSVDQAGPAPLPSISH